MGKKSRRERWRLQSRDYFLNGSPFLDPSPGGWTSVDVTREISELRLRMTSSGLSQNKLIQRYLSLGRF